MNEQSANTMTFECLERGCENIVRFISENLIELRIGFGNYATFFRCDKCGRVYHNNGTPALNRELNKVFIVGGDVENRSHDASEKMILVQDLITAATMESKAQADHATRDLWTLYRKGHSRDCSIHTGETCNCGSDLAQDWLNKTIVPISA